MRKQYIISFCILAGILGSLFYFIIYPQYQSVEMMKKHLASLDKELADAKRAARDLDKILKEFKDRKAEVETTDKLLPDEADIEALVTMIADVCRETNLTLLTCEAGPEKDKGFYARIILNTKISGESQDILAFLKKVSELPRLVLVKDFRMDADDHTKTVVAAFKVTAFRYFAEGKKKEAAELNRYPCQNR